MMLLEGITEMELEKLGTNLTDILPMYLKAEVGAMNLLKEWEAQGKPFFNADEVTADTIHAIVADPIYTLISNSVVDAMGSFAQSTALLVKIRDAVQCALWAAKEVGKREALAGLVLSEEAKVADDPDVQPDELQE
jgi:hypothetical protein